MSVGLVEFWIFVAVIAGVYGLFSLGIQLQFGYAGILNFGAVAYMLVAAYTMAILIVRFNLDLWLAALFGVGAAVVVSVIVALPTLRLRAIYFGFAAIAVGEILRYMALNLTTLTGGDIGTVNLLGPANAATYTTQWYGVQDKIDSWLKPFLGPFATRDVAMAIVVWVVLAVCLVLLEALVRSPWGRVLKAIREDEDVAAAMGKQVFLYKLQSFVIGGAIGGLSGVFLALELSAFAPTDFLPIITFYGFVIVLLSGTAKMWAVPAGSILFALVFAGTLFFNFWPFTLFDSTARQYIRLLAVGLIFIGIMLFRPQGLFGRKEELVL